MNRHISIAEIADRLHPTASRFKAMALLEAYFDESGTHASSTITAIAGYVATKATWVDLESKWKEELALLADQGVTAFHMHDAIVGGDQYGRVDHFHRMAHIKRLSQLLRDADVHAISVYVDNADWESVVIDADFLKAYPTPYALCFEHIVHWLRGWSKQHANGETVAPMFAYTDEHTPRAAQRYGAQSWYRDVLGAIAFDYPSRVMPLQAADFIAHQVRYDAHRWGYDELTLQNMGDTLAFSNATAKNGRDMMRGYDHRGLPGAIKRFHETGLIW